MRVSLINLNLIGPDAIGQNLLQQLRFFQRSGDEARIYVPTPPEQIPDDVLPFVTVTDAETLRSGADAHFAASDLYVFHYGGWYDLLESLQTLARGAVILNYHNVTPPALWQGGEAVKTALAAGVDGVSRIAALADLIVTPSQFNAGELTQRYAIDADRIRVVPLPVALERFAQGAPDPALVQAYDLTGQRVTLYVGRMAGNKRVDLLIEAMPAVLAAVPNALLLLVGDDRSNPDFRAVVAACRERAAALGIGERVRFTGRVDDLPAHYRLAEVYATASLHEGFGVPLIEAMASGLPVVAANATAHPWVLGDAGLLTDPADPAALAAALIQLLTDDQRYGEQVRRGLARAAEFSVERFRVNWADAVAETLRWLPNRTFTRYTRPANGAKTAVQLRLAGLDKEAKVMPEQYVVRSGVPLVGPGLAWFRRNLTSHLREPYLDPMMRRQEKFNRRVVESLAALAGAQAEGAAAGEAERSRLAALEAQCGELAAQVARLQRELDQLRGMAPGPDAEPASAHPVEPSP